MTEEIRVEHREQVVWLTLNRPAKKNALTLRMYEQLCEALARAADDEQARVVVLQGSGSGFTAGNDLRDFDEHPPEDASSPVLRFLATLLEFPKPLVAAVHGPAIGVGTTLLLHCDFVLSTPDAIFQLPFVPLGLCPEAGASVLLPHVVGRLRASELLLLGERFDGARAHHLGLVNELVEPDRLPARAEDRARQLAALPAEAVRITKRLVQQGLLDQARAAMDRETREFVALLQSPAAARARAEFFARRKP